MKTEVQTQVLAEARSWIGTPYVHQASNKQVGTDCLGLVRGIWRVLYGVEPEQSPAYTPDWGQADNSEPMLAAAGRYFEEIKGELIPGCLIIFRWQTNCAAKHAGIYSGGNKFIHAYERVGVVESSLGHHWKNKIASKFLFPKLAQQIKGND